MIALGLFVAPALAALALTRGRLEIGLLVGVGTGQWLAGSWLTRGLHPALFAVCASGALALFAGYALASRSANHEIELGDEQRWRLVLAPLATVTLVLVAVHFIRGGVPLFSGHVETSRFDVSKSGLLGIPSRAYLFGLPAIAIAYGALRNRTRNEGRMFAAVAATLVASRILGGLKSGLLEVTFVVLVTLIIRTNGTARITSPLVLRRAAFGVLAIVFAGFLSTQYATVRAASASAAAGYLVKRATTGTVSAGAWAVSPRNLPYGGPFMLKDFLYYSNKYSSGIPARAGLFTAPRYNTSRIASASLVGLSADTDRYVTPVAMGLAPSLFLDWRWPGVVIGMILVGYVLRGLQWRSLRSGGLPAGLWGMSALTTVYVIDNGGLAYYTINFLGTAALYIAIALVLSAMAGIAAQADRRLRVRPT